MYTEKHMDNSLKAQKIKAIIFDLDGTLADTVEAIAEAVNLTMEHFGYKTHSCDEVRRAVGNGARMLIKRCMPEPDSFDDEKVSHVLSHYDDMYRQTYIHTDRCYDGVREAVIKLAESGFKVAILSNKQNEYVKALAKILFPSDIISIAQGQTDLPIKPDPTVPLMIAERLGVRPEECAFVGDSDVDVMTAHSAGMVQLGVSWGFRSKEVLLSAGATDIADTPEQMLNFFIQ